MPQGRQGQILRATPKGAHVVFFEHGTAARASTRPRTYLHAARTHSCTHAAPCAATNAAAHSAETHKHRHTQLPQQRPDCTTALTSRWPIVGVRACVCSQGRETRRKHGYQVVHTHRSHNLKRQLPIPTHRITCQWSYSSTPSVFWKKFTILVSAAARGMLGQNKDGLRCPVRSVLDVDSTFAL